MFGWLREFMRKQIASPLPAEMNGCGYCNVGSCTDVHYLTCTRRLAYLNPAQAFHKGRVDLCDEQMVPHVVPFRRRSHG